MEAAGSAYFQNVWYDIVTGLVGAGSDRWFGWSDVALVLKGLDDVNTGNFKQLVITKGNVNPGTDYTNNNFQYAATNIGFADTNLTIENPVQIGGENDDKNHASMEIKVTGQVMGPEATGFSGTVNSAELWVKCNDDPASFNNNTVGNPTNWWANTAPNASGEKLADLNETHISTANNSAQYEYSKWNKFATLSTGADFTWSADSTVPGSDAVLDGNDRVKDISFKISVDSMNTSKWMNASPTSAGVTTNTGGNAATAYKMDTIGYNVLETHRNLVFLAMAKDGEVNAGRINNLRPHTLWVWSMVKDANNDKFALQVVADMGGFEYGPGFAYVSTGQITKGRYDDNDGNLLTTLPDVATSDADDYWNKYRITLQYGVDGSNNPLHETTVADTVIPSDYQPGDSITLVLPYGQRNRVEA